jgi:hypothetical protein
MNFVDYLPQMPLSNIIGNYENRKPESRAESVLTDNYESEQNPPPPPTPSECQLRRRMSIVPRQRSAQTACRKKSRKQEEGNFFAEIEGDKRRQTLVLLSV